MCGRLCRTLVRSPTRSCAAIASMYVSSGPVTDCPTAASPIPARTAALRTAYKSRTTMSQRWGAPSSGVSVATRRTRHRSRSLLHGTAPHLAQPGSSARFSVGAAAGQPVSQAKLRLASESHQHDQPDAVPHPLWPHPLLPDPTCKAAGTPPPYG